MYSPPKLQLDYGDQYGRHVPVDMREAIERYVFDGLEPGGFLVSVFSHDLMGSVHRIHAAIPDHFVGIVRWVRWYTPEQCQGSAQRVGDWIQDRDLRRTIWVREWQKQQMWRTLSNKDIENQ
jgi:hypothetical protein